MENVGYLIFCIAMISLWLYGVWEFTGWLTRKLVPAQYLYQENDKDDFDIHYLNYVSEVLPGETYADNVVGATLCPNCQYYFRQDDTYDDELCKECVS